jgi:hypothetical protein
MGFNLDDYEPVASRLSRWLNWAAERNLQPRVVTHLVHYTDDRCVFRAELYTLDLNNARHGLEVMHATGWAEETRGDGNVNRTSHLENCESSAVGRALANAGLAGSDPSKRPSREEMGKVARSGGAPAAGSGNPATESQQTFLRKLMFAQLIKTEEDIQAKVDEALGTPVLVSQLTAAQASKVIDYMKARA